jgi:DNA transformation protein
MRYRRGMAKDEFAQNCCELLSGMGRCTAKRMFGGHGISCEGLTLALVADLGGGEKLWLKADADTRARFEAAGCERFSYQITRNGQQSEHSLNYYAAPEEAMESPQVMRDWARLAFESALKAHAAKAAQPVRAKKPAAKKTIKAVKAAAPRRKP